MFFMRACAAVSIGPRSERELNRGTCHLCVERIEPRVGDCIFLPAGIVHALGAGLMVAEIQQSSDVTYRLYDWNRVGPDGRPRQVHIAEALDALDFDYGPVKIQSPLPIESSTAVPTDFSSGATRQVPDAAGCEGERLVTCDQFVLDRWRFDRPHSIGGDQRFHILIVLGGSMRIAGDPAPEPLRLGEVALLPAACGPTLLTPAAPVTLLDVYLP